MRFTRRTYRKAIKRSIRFEYELFKLSFWSTTATQDWYRQTRITLALRARAMREGKEPV